ncbi:hypothetical protein OGAPHI_002052 [Ogataea philodendri]|uniref:Uncharacterized protein n=1 Tax=Ogataea philodendri TaxID=1378263 RepID=A0A9P8T6N4_9ASCO|nr:uncharacterized protein OGAPHI_002052 [Ogataea philodendri]KAH3668298.1 hypothetical protein OGAPHI_002052 [Ogataea philodendri]
MSGVLSAPLYCGKLRIGIIKTTNATATHPEGSDMIPKFQGPLRKVFLEYVILRSVGIVKEMNDPIAPTEKMALIGVSPPNISKSNNSPINQLAHTALTGVLVNGFTDDHHLESGKHPSLEYEKSTREAAIIHENDIANDKTTAKAVRACQDDGSWSCNLSVGTLLCQVERRVETRHGPNNGHETHQDANSVRPFGIVGDAPGDIVCVEFRQALVLSSVSSQNNHKRDKQEQ